MTFRQRLAASKMVENGGNISQAMRDAGYSPATAKTPQKLTKSKSWQKLMKKYLHDEYLISKHIQLLDATVSDKLVFEDDVPDEVLEKMIKLVSYSGSQSFVLWQLMITSKGIWIDGTRFSPSIFEFGSKNLSNSLWSSISELAKIS